MSSNSDLKYYGPGDFSIAVMSEPLYELLDNFEPTHNYDINGICNLYNALKFFKILDDDLRVRYLELERPIEQAIGIFWSRVTNENFIRTIKNIKKCYFDDLIEMTVVYNVIEKDDEDIIFERLDNIGLPLCLMLKNEKFVKHFKNRIKNLIMGKPENAELLIQKYIKQVRPELKCYIPDVLTEEDELKLVNDYLDSNFPNPNYVDLLVRKIERPRLDDKTRLKAKKLSEKYTKDLFKDKKSSLLKVSVTASISESQIEPLVIEGVGTRDEKFIFSKKHLEEDLSCGGILKNFSDVLGYINYGGTLYLPSRESELGTLEKHLSIHSKKEYRKGILFSVKNMEIIAKTNAYTAFLRNRNIDIVDIMQETASAFLKKEFGVEGIVFNAPKSKDLFEKNRLMLIELDNIVRRFNLYTKELEVDEELYAISSSTPGFSEIGTLMKKKYLEVNPDNEKIKKIQFYLFSDQSPLTYIDDGPGANDLVGLLIKNHIKMSNLSKSQRKHMELLVEQGIIEFDSKENLVLAKEVTLLSKIYRHGTIMYELGSDHEKELLRAMEAKGWLKERNRLLSTDEANWLNYMLNSKEFDNGPELRNRYIHAAQSKDLSNEELERDYLTIVVIVMSLLLKIVGELYILKINSEEDQVD